MNTYELIESTMLHAMGMLDDDERQAYEAAFELAAPQVQERVRAEAERMADLGDLMKDIDGMSPSVELRSLVLSAVRAAMIEKENEARIAQASSVSPVIAKIEADSMTSNSTKHSQRSTNTRTAAQPRFTPSKRVHWAWRVGAISSAAAMIAIGVVSMNIQNTYNGVESKSQMNALIDLLGAEETDGIFFDQRTHHTILASQEPESKAGVAVYSNPDWDTAKLIVNKMTPQDSGPLRLVVLDSEGNIVQEVATFVPTGELERFEIDANFKPDAKLAILPFPSQETMAAEIQRSNALFLSQDSEI